MVVEAIANPKMIDDDDDDDAPLVFRRRDISKQRQLNSESKVRASAQSDKLSGKVHNGRDSNDRASSAPKGKVVQASKPTSSKLPVSTLSGKISPLKSTSQTPSSSRGRDDDDDDDDDTCLVFKRRDKSLQHQLNPEQKVRDSAQANKPLERVQDARSSNDQASCALKGKMVQASKPSSSVLPAVQKSSTLSGKISPLKSTPQPPSSSLSRDDDDDDDCIVFKRRDKSIQQHQLNPEQKVRDLAQANKPLEKVQDARSSNDHATCALKGKMVQASKPLSSVLPAVQKSSTLSGKISPLKSTPQPPSSSLSRDGNKIRTEKLVTVKDEKPSKEVAKEKTPLTSDYEDSEDEKPLSSRLSIKKSIANPGNKQRGSSSKSLNGNYSDLSDDDKPLAAKLLQNGFIKRENQTKKPSVVPAKRPSTASSSDQSSAKKLKPLSQTTTEKAKMPPMKSEIDDENDNIPIAQRMKQPNVAKKSEAFKQKVTKVNSSSFKKKGKKNIKKVKNQSKFSRSSKMLPGSGDGQKWTTLVHSGVIFPPPYSPHGVKILYDGKPVDLTSEQEEVATMYAVMLDTDYIQKEKFNENFFGDWKKILGRNHVIKDLKKCDFTPIQQWHLCEKEKKKQMTTEEKKTIKEEKLKQEEKYMWAIVDGVKEKVGNFRVEPPGLFRGRGEHPKMGKLKKRILPSDITLNIGKGVPVPECPIAGERWKEIRHDNTVTWLAFWNDPINPKEFKYVFLAASSTLKGQSDKEKYEKARMLKDYIQGIRAAYTKDFTSKDMTKRQIAVATYLIDRLALRAGNEKDDDEADTVGCCTLKVENVSPLPPNILEFDFLGKDSIRYHKQFEAEPLVFNAVEIFRKGKKGSDDLFDMLDTSKLNAHLKELMPGLTAKVFRTYNASITLDEMLSKGAEDGDLTHKVCRYQVANKEVAIICNHQRSVSKSHNAQMERLTDKIKELKDTLSELETDLSRAKKGKPPLKDDNGKQKKNLTPEAIGKKIEQTKAKIDKMERDMKSKEDLKEIALGTSRINYLDPRITVAWCKRNEVPIEKIFNKSLLAKFAWSMDCDPAFRF